MIAYLYKKTHKDTGMKYLGMTVKKDPFKYKGSGTYWQRHIKKHGYNVETEILLETQDLEELRRVGIHYSILWNVVESDEWANLKEESGDGFTSLFNKQKWKDSNHRSMMIEKRQNQWNDELKKWRSEETKRQMSDPEMKKNWEEANKARWQDPEYVKKTSERRKGPGNNRFDRTIYHFVNDDGTEERCTRYDLYTKYHLLSDKVCELINGNRKSHKGWRLQKEKLV